MSENTIIVGRNPIKEAFENGVPMSKVFLQKEIHGELEKEMRALCKTHNIPLAYVPKEKLASLSKANHQGVIALISPVEILEWDELLPKLVDNKSSLFLVILDGITDVRNFGAIARSALAFKADALIFSSNKSAAINDEALKASAGALLELPVCRVKSLATLIESLAKMEVQIAVADIGHDKGLTDLPVKDSIAIVLGSEGEGVSKHIKQYADLIFSINQSPDFDSLNVSVAAGIIFHHIFDGRKIV